jgi:thiaminase/transcriptional activator TenA
VKLSLIAIENTGYILNAIIRHRFVKEAVQGNLDRKIFNRYVEQDRLFLPELSNCYSVLAIKSPKYSEDFSKYAKRTIISEQEMLRKFFEEDTMFNNTGFVTEATSAYIKHIRHNCIDNPLEIGVASLLACFTVYERIGAYSLHNSPPNNPYVRWTGSCSNQKFTTSVKRAEKTFDELADNANEATRQKMVDAYTLSCQFEHDFFEGVCDKKYGAIKDSKDLLPIPNQIVKKPHLAQHQQNYDKISRF